MTWDTSIPSKFFATVPTICSHQFLTFDNDVIISFETPFGLNAIVLQGKNLASLNLESQKELLNLFPQGETTSAPCDNGQVRIIQSHYDEN